MQDRIETIIRDWLNKEFKNPKAIPGLMVKGLAEEINNHRWEIYRYVKEEYDLEDIEQAANDKEVELTDEEMEIVLHKYQDSDYQDVDTISWLIDRIVETREKSDDSEREEEAAAKR